MRGEIARRLGRSRTADLVEPCAIGLQDKVVRRDPLDNFAGEPRHRAGLRHEKEDPCAFPVPLHQTRLDEQP